MPGCVEVALGFLDDLGGSAVLMPEARCPLGTMIYSQTWATFSSVSGVSPETFFRILVVCSLLRGLMRSGP